MTARRDSAALTVASVVNGIAAYATAVIASRGLDDLGFAAFSVSWSLWALSVALLVFPVQHWIIWRRARDGDTAAVRSALPKVLVVFAVVIVILFAAGNSERLFPVGSGWGLLLAVIGVSSALLGLGRGLLAAGGRYDSLAWVIGSENVLRLVAVTVAVVLLGREAQWAILGLSVGILALIPFSPKLRFTGGESSVKVRVLAELGALAGATALAHAMVQFPPAAAEWLGESPERVSAIFATFSVGRAPFLVVLAVSARLTAPLTRFLSEPVVKLRRSLTRTMIGLVLATVLAGMLGYVVGPVIVAWFFGPSRALGGIETALVAAGLVMATAGVLITLALMVKRANRIAATFWAASVVVAILLAVYGVSVPVAFFAGEAMALVLSAGALWHLVTRAQSASSSSVKP